MMLIIDYIFFRTYKINYPNDSPWFTGIVSTFMVFGGISAPIWLGINSICYHNTTTIGPVTWIVIAFFWILLTYRYVKKKKEILVRFEKSKYNTMIPFWAIQIFILLCIGIGIALTAAFVEPYIDSHNLEGFLYEYIPWFLK